MKVIIDFKGKEYVIQDASKAESVAKFKNKVEIVTDVEVQRQTLLFGGKVLVDSTNVNLSDYRIENGMKVYLLEKADNSNENKENNNECGNRCDSPPPMDEIELDEPTHIVSFPISSLS